MLACGCVDGVGFLAEGAGAEEEDHTNRRRRRVSECSGLTSIRLRSGWEREWWYWSGMERKERYLHECMRKPDFRTIHDPTAHAFHQREHIVVLRVQHDSFQRGFERV